jgi:NADH-quinone oxidoreductase subunit L
VVAIPSVLIGLAGIALAGWLYFKKNAMPDRLADGIHGLYRASFRKFYIDEVYLFITHKIIFAMISQPVAWFDRHIVDGTMNLIGNTTVACSAAIKKMQSGHVQGYIWFFMTGVLLLALLILSLT